MHDRTGKTTKSTSTGRIPEVAAQHRELQLWCIRKTGSVTEEIPLTHLLSSAEARLLLLARLFGISRPLYLHMYHCRLCSHHLD